MADSRLTLNEMPDEALGEVLIRSPQATDTELPAQLAALRVVSKRFNAIIQQHLQWAEKVRIHFPRTYKQYKKSKKPVNWLEVFKEQYTTQYKKLTPRLKKLISLIKENGLDGIKFLQPEYAELAICITADGFITPIVRHTENKEILKYLYDNVILPHLNNRDDDDSTTILYWAIVCQIDAEEIDTALFKYNLANSQEVYFKNEISPLHIAALYGRVDVMIKLVTKHGAELDKKNKDDQTALFFAAFNNQLDAVQWLADEGSSLDVATAKSHFTALSIAASKGHDQVVRLLLQKGANAKVKSGKTNFQAIHIAARDHQLSCVQALIEHDKSLLDETDDRGATPLHVAAEWGHADVVAYLIAQGAKITLASNEVAGEKDRNKTPVMIAADYICHNNVILLLDAGADFTALVDYLLTTDNSVILRQLIAQRPALFSPALKNSLLLRAAAEGKSTISACLLQHLADTSVSNEEGYAAIHLAAMHGQLECVKILVEHEPLLVGVPYCHQGSPDHGKNALFLAHEENHSDIVKYLLEKMSERQLFAALMFAIQTNKLTLAEMILEDKPELACRMDATKRTPLALAVELQNQAAIDLCYRKNQFAEPNPAVFKDMESYKEFHASIIELNVVLQNIKTPDVRLMQDTHVLLGKLNNSDSSQVSISDKMTAINTYYTANHTISDEKYRLSIHGIIGITLGLFLVTAASAVLIPFAIALLLALAAAATTCVLISRFGIFAETIQQYVKEQAALEMTDVGKRVLVS